jgi:hypothetical protein
MPQGATPNSRAYAERLEAATNEAIAACGGDALRCREGADRRQRVFGSAGERVTNCGFSRLQSKGNLRAFVP